MMGRKTLAMCWVLLPKAEKLSGLGWAEVFAHCTMLCMDSTSKVLPDHLSCASGLVISFKLIQMALQLPSFKLFVLWQIHVV